MSRATLLRLSAPTLALALGLAAANRSTAPAAAAGPPWLSVEMPANPMDASTRDAAFLIHAYHHGDAAGIPIEGTAEGLVRGERRSLSLEIARTSRGNVYAVKQQWPAEGAWVLAIRTAGHATASLLIELGSDGGVSAEPYYSMRSNALALRSVRVVSGEAGAARIESALQALASSQ